MSKTLSVGITLLEGAPKPALISNEWPADVLSEALAELSPPQSSRRLLRLRCKGCC